MHYILAQGLGAVEGRCVQQSSQQWRSTDAICMTIVRLQLGSSTTSAHRYGIHEIDSRLVL